MSAIDLLQCPYCAGRAFDAQAERVECLRCRRIFPVQHGVLNTLVEPSGEVLKELRGMMQEYGLSHADVGEFIVYRVERIESFEELKASTRGEAFDYYGCTGMNFQQALEHVSMRRGDRVLEVGGHGDFPFLAPFAQAGCACFATNIHFVVDARGAQNASPARIAGDMNALPYRDDCFDVTLVSATTHHSNDLERTVSELARVTRPGGAVLILNEPIGGVLKHALDFLRPEARNRGRHELVHENEYPIWRYARLFRRHGLVLKQSLFSAYYEDRLARAELGAIRFARLARLVARLWRYPRVRRLLRTHGLLLGQVLIGLQLNVVLTKT